MDKISPVIPITINAKPHYLRFLGGTKIAMKRETKNNPQSRTIGMRMKYHFSFHASPRSAKTPTAPRIPPIIYAGEDLHFFEKMR